MHNPILRATRPDQIRSCYEVIRQLYPHYRDAEAFLSQVEKQLRGGYHLVYLEEEGEVKAVMGFRIFETLCWGKVFYIDDLVTAAAARHSGHGNELLQWAIEHAKEAGCAQVHLDGSPERHDAHRFYLNHGFKIVAYYFALNLQDLE